MDLIVNEVVELEVIHYTNGYGVVEGLARAAVVKSYLTVDNLKRLGLHKSAKLLVVINDLLIYPLKIGLAVLANDFLEYCLTAYALTGTDVTGVVSPAEHFKNVGLLSTVEYGGHYLDTKLLTSDTKMHFKHLTDVHTGRNAERVKNYIKRSTVSKEGHILGRKNPRNDTLVTVAARHLVTDGDLSLLSNVNVNYLVYAGSKIVGIRAVVDLNVYYDTVFSVTHFEGGILNLACLFTEYCAKKSLLGSKLGLTLGSNLTYEYISCADLGTDSYDTVVIEVLYHILGNVGYLASDLLHTKLGITRFNGIFVNMDRGIYVVADEVLVKKNCVLVVVTLPGHKADKSILTERDFTVRGSGTVCNNLSLLYSVALVNDRSVAYTGRLVGSLILYESVNVLTAVVGKDNYFLAGALFNDTRLACYEYGTRVYCRLVLHTGSNDRRVGDHKRNRLLLHVRSHECTGVVVVLKEGYAACRNRNCHLRASVHKVNVRRLNLNELGLVSCNNLLINEVTVLVEMLVSLSNYVVVLFVCGEVNDLVGNAAGSLVNDSVWSLKESVIAYLCIGCKVGDKTDVGTLGGLDGAYSAVVCIVYVTNLEGSPVSRETAGTKRGKTALVGKLCKGVVLVHEL